jgi:hypothetical protein
MGAEAVAGHRTWQVRGRAAQGLTVVGGVLAFTGWFLAKSGNELGMTVFLVGWGTAALSYAFLGAFEQLSLTRLMEDLPTSKLRSAPQGYIEIRGTVQPGGELLTCPVCQRSCYWFQYFRDKGKERVTPARRIDILIDDGTGRCWLRPAGAELTSTRRREGAHAHICPGDPIYALGEFRTTSSRQAAAAAGAMHELATERVDRAHAAAVRQKLQWLKYDARRMAVFDVNRDGKLDEREHAAMAKVADQHVRRDQAKAAAEPPPPDSVLAQPTSDVDRLPFVIVVGSEKDARKATLQDVLSRGALAVMIGGFLSVFAIGNANMKLQKELEAELRGPTASAGRSAPMPRTVRQRAFDAHKSADFVTALSLYDQLLLDNAYDGEAAFWRGNALGRLGRNDEAVASVQRSCDLGFQRGCDFLAQHREQLQ